MLNQRIFSSVKLGMKAGAFFILLCYFVTTEHYFLGVAIGVLLFESLIPSKWRAGK